MSEPVHMIDGDSVSMICGQHGWDCQKTRNWNLVTCKRCLTYKPKAPAQQDGDK